jgi:uncharacterized protein (TIGR02996 family)
MGELCEGVMSDGDALISAILAHPDEDVPRLVYADWLDESGDEFDRARAEFIRVQIALAGISPVEFVPWNKRLIELRAREKALLTVNGMRWLEPLRDRGGPLESTDTHAQFRRGFVEVVWMPAPWFIFRAEALFASAPARELRVTRTTITELAALVGNEHFPRLTALDLSDRKLGDKAVSELTRRAVAGLTTLRVSGCGLTDAGAHRFATVPFDWPLRELDVRHNPIGAEGLAELYGRFGGAVVSSEPAR